MVPDVEARLRERFSRDAGTAIAVYLFGSRARGTARPDSDLDLGILFAEPPPKTLLGQPFALEDELRGMVGAAVQIVVLNTAPPDLTHRVLRDGILLHDRDPAARIRFEVAARSAYFDLMPILEQYRRSG